jgi:hypothetical protein
MAPDTAVAASLAALNGGPPVQHAHYEVTWTDGKPPKLLLPDPPGHDQPVALCAWLTCVLNLDPAKPVTGAVHQGKLRTLGHVEIRRLDASPIRFEPAKLINTARSLRAELVWQISKTDGEPYGFTDANAGRIAYVLRLLTDGHAHTTDVQETTGIISAYLAVAVRVEGYTTFGKTVQRYEAVKALQPELDSAGRPVSPPRYLIDENTGEIVIRVGDLQDTARRFIGSSIAHGWLDGRMEALGWDRCSIDGRVQGTYAGRNSPHLQTNIYRGHLPREDDTDE